MSVNARVQAIKVLVTCRLIFAAVILKRFLQNKARISRLVNSGKITKAVEVVTDLIETSIIGESRSRHMLFNLTLPLTYFTKRNKKKLIAHLFLHFLYSFSSVVIIIVALITTIINAAAAVNTSSNVVVTFIAAADRITTITIIITVIKTGTRNAEAIGTIAADRVLSPVLRALTTASVVKERLLNNRSHSQKTALLLNNSKMNPSTLAGRNPHSRTTTTTIDRVDMEASGTTAAVKWTTLSHCPAMSASNKNSSARTTLASISTSTKTFPWKRRVRMFPNTLHLSRTVS